MTSVAQWVGRHLTTKRSLVQFPVRTHAWVVGQVPGWGPARGNWSMFLSHIHISLHLFFPPSSSIKVKNQNLTKKKKKDLLCLSPALNIQVHIQGWAKPGLQLWIRKAQSLFFYYYLPITGFSARTTVHLVLPTLYVRIKSERERKSYHRLNSHVRWLPASDTHDNLFNETSWK